MYSVQYEDILVGIQDDVRISGVELAIVLNGPLLDLELHHSEYFQTNLLSCKLKLSDNLSFLQMKL